jgi:hypothetical protein
LKTTLPLCLGMLLATTSLPLAAEVNLRVNPVGLLIGVLNLEADFKVGGGWTLGPTIRYHSYDDGLFDIKTFGAGIRGNYWFNSSALTQGWYFGPSLNYVTATVVEDGVFGRSEGSGSGLGLVAIFGYQWMWDSFNINLGAGPTYVSVNEVTVTDAQGNRDTYDGIKSGGLSIEFTTGWKF